MKITKILIWIVGLSLIFYFLFISLEVRRKPPTKISPVETTTPLITPEEREQFPQLETSTEINP